MWFGNSVEMFKNAQKNNMSLLGGRLTFHNVADIRTSLPYLLAGSIMSCYILHTDHFFIYQRKGKQLSCGNQVVSDVIPDSPDFSLADVLEKHNRNLFIQGLI